jgi:hypothetical protein
LSNLIAKMAKMPATDVRLLMLHRYETDWGIYNHDLSDDETDPLALIRMHSREDAYTGSYLSERIRQYHQRHVWEVTHEPLSVFLSYPRHMVMDILEYADKELRARTKVMENEANAADQRVQQAQQIAQMRPPQ